MYSAAVVGLGNIGLMYDLHERREVTLTHCNAYTKHTKYKLVCGVDNDLLKRRLFEREYDLPTFPSLKEIPSKFSIDVLSICVPTSQQYTIINQAFDSQVKSIILEKPVGQSYNQAQTIFRKIKEKQIPVSVNYFRRYEPGAIEIKKLLEIKKLGKIHQVHFSYSKGIYAFASHLINLCIFWFGIPLSIKKISTVIKLQNDYLIDFSLEFLQTKVYFFSIVDYQLSILEGEIIGSNGKIVYGELGERIKMFEKMTHPIFKQANIFSDEGCLIKTEFNHYQLHVLDAHDQMIKNNSIENSDMDAAVMTSKIIEQITIEE